MTTAARVIQPQAGPQELFLRKRWVDFIVYGGSAGGGKSFGLLLDSGWHAFVEPVKGYGAVIFRRTSPQITATGGLWDTSQLVYPYAGAKPRKTPWLGWEWAAYGTSVRFHHLQHEDDKLAWQGAQVDYIGFDELTHFTEGQVFYMLSRNRSVNGVKPMMRATTNPDPESWVRRFLAPWVDDTYPDPAASGEVRWFYRDGDTVVWMRKPGERPPHVPRENVYSVSFIEARLEDNPALMASDPGYKGRLQALPFYERMILTGGKEAWKIQRDGNLFKRHWFPIVDAAPADLQAVVRRWDLAGTEPRKGFDDPDYTAGVQMGRARDGRYYVLDCILEQLSPAGVQALVKQTAQLDGRSVAVRLAQDPGQAGKDQLDDYVTLLDGFDARGERETGDKAIRAAPFSAQAEAGNVLLVKGHWNGAYLNQLVAFPNPRIHDDAVDASDGAHRDLLRLTTGGVAFW
jgi:predicted phage terminase large subunit-like protein